MARKKKTYDDDDGRVIASMNVDGMPWYMGEAAGREKKFPKSESSSDLSDLTRGETWEIIKGTVKAGLLIGSIFIAAAGLFILFCIYVWFR